MTHAPASAQQLPAVSSSDTQQQLHKVIATCRAELAEHYAVVQQEKRRKLQRWQDEEPMLECQIEALAGTRDIIQREQKQLTTELASLKAFLDKQAAEAALQASSTQQQGGSAEALASSDDEATLQQQLQQVNSKIAELDEELTALVPKLSDTSSGGCRPDELSYYETKLVVIQDTRRLLQAEATALTSELKRRQSAAKLAADKHTAAELGLSDLGRLGERLAGVEAALDRAKVERYFPAQRGFRFSGGGGGVYCGVKDLHLNEISGAFSVALEAVPAPAAATAAAAGGGAGGGAGGQREVRLKVTLSGIASGGSSEEYKHQQQQQKQQQAAKAAAQSKALKRQQSYQQQQQQHQHHGSPLRRSVTATQQQQGAAGSPLRQQFAGSASVGSSGSSSSGGGNRRNAAIAKFLGQLNEKKDALSQALTKGLDHTGQTINPAGDSAGASASGGGLPAGAAAGSGFSSHLAGTFGDKAAGFSQRRDMQGSAAAGQGGGDGSLDGGLLGAGLSAAGQAGSSDIGSGSIGVPPSSSATDGGSSSVSIATAAAGAGAGDAASAADSSEAAAAAVSQQQPHSPTASSSSRQQEAGASSQLVRANSSSSTGSGSGWGQGLQHQQQQHTGSPVKAKFGGMKGKLGGLLAESKQKLADTQQKLADSKLVQESKQKLADTQQKLADSKLVQESKQKLADSKQKLADSKQKLADSKLFTESKAAAKHLIEDSRVLFEDGKAGLKKGLSNLQDGSSPQKQQQQWPSKAGVGGDRGAAAALQQDSSTPRSSLDRQQQQPEGQQQQEQQQPAEGGSPSVDQAAAAVSQAAAGGVEGDSSVSDGGDGTPSAAVAAAAPTTPAFPGIVAATAAAASSGDLDRSLLDEAFIGDSQGGVHAGSIGGGGSGAGWLLGGGGATGGGVAAAATAGIAGGKGAGSRKGVVVMLLAEGLEILGEKGTKVPNIRAARLGLEVECVLSASLTYSSTLGWQKSELSFEVLSLERAVEGANIPLPNTLIKMILNLVMPSVFTKMLLTSLPHELGQFILDSAATAAASSSTNNSSSSNHNAAAASGQSSPVSAAAAAVAAAGGAGVWLSGELCLTGPPLACLSASLTRSAEEVPPGRVSLTSFVQELRAAQMARALLNLPDPMHARALALLFTPGSPFCLLDGSPAGSTHASTTAAAAAGGAAAGSSSGSSSAAAAGATAAGGSSCSSVLGVPASLTLRELCRFYLDYSDSSVWGSMLEMWQVAVDAVCLHLAREEGLLLQQPSTDTQLSSGSTTAAGQPAASAQEYSPHSFSFEALFSRVSSLVRKPVRLCFGLHKLLLGVDAAAGLTAARDYCERAAREFAEQAKGQDALLLLQRPLSQQLELLHLWHAALQTYLQRFLQQFKEAGGRVLVAADKASFSIAVEQLQYEGPLKLQIPLPLLADLAVGAATFDLSLPNPESAVSSLAHKLRFINSALAKAAYGKSEEECAAARHAAAVAEAVKSGSDVPLTMLEELEALMTIWFAGASEREQQAYAAARAKQAAAAAAADEAATSNSSTVRDSSSGGSGIKLTRVTSSSTAAAAAAAAATASITRNSLTHSISRTSSVHGGGATSTSTPGSSPSKPQAAPAAGAVAAAVGGDGTCGVAAAAGVDNSNSSSTSTGLLGRISLTKASAGLVLDETRLKQLMSGWSLQGPGLLSGLLGCFGQLFTATVAPGWPSQQQDSLLAASTADLAAGSSSSVGGGGSIDGGGGNDGSNSSSQPQAILTLRNNEITRVKADVEAASFESAVSPRIAVRLLHMLLLAVAHKFGDGSSKRLEVIHKVFTHVAEYLGRDCLDLLVCVDVAATAAAPTTASIPSAAGGAGGGGGGGGLGASSLQQQGPALQLLLAGAAPGASSAGSSANSAAASGSGGGGGACCYLINDVNLLTVLDTVRLLMDYSS